MMLMMLIVLMSKSVNSKHSIGRIEVDYTSSYYVVVARWKSVSLGVTQVVRGCAVRV